MLGRYIVHRRVVVNLWSGAAIVGVVTRARRGYLVLRDAQVHEPGATGAVPADGEVIVPRDQIDYMQAPS